MARLRTNFNESFDNTRDAEDPIPLGWTREDFRDRDLEVRNAGPRGFLDDSFDGPGGARITGRGLQYRDVTKFGHTIETPFRGTLTGREEESGRFSLDFDFEVSARDFFRATRTNGDRDNFALFRSLFDGRDVLDLNGRGDDEIDGFAGADLLRLGRGDDVGYGSGGRDRLFGEAGDDILEGGAGRDRLIGGRGADVLEGGRGDDSVNGGAGADALEGGKGRDALRGGGGPDEFLFAGRRLGRDVVEDFGGRDTVVIDSPGVDRFADLKLREVDGDAAVRFNGTLVVFEGLERGDLRAGMFEFE